MPGTFGALAACLRRCAGAIVFTLALGSAPAHAVTATWLGGTGNWDDATRWDTDPLFPCNGQGGNTYDVVFSSGTLTLNLNCTIDSYTVSSGTQNGGFDLIIGQSLSWSSGAMGGSGTTTVNGGLDATSGFTKGLTGTRTLVHAGGTGSWSAGTIALGSGGATLRNETIWNLTGFNRSMSDTSDTGSFENTSAGTLNVDLDLDTQTVTISTGSVQNDGTVNANVGALAFFGDGTHTGTFAGPATVRFSGGSQTLGTGANITVAPSRENSSSSHRQYRSASSMGSFAIM